MTTEQTRYSTPPMIQVAAVVPSETSLPAEPAAAPVQTAIDPHGRLSSPSFIRLLIVQFLTVLNDHTFRWLAIPLTMPLMHRPGTASTDQIALDAAMLSGGLAVFTLPFLLLATPAGYFADRFSKARVISACKLAEILIMSLGFLALILQRPFTVLFVIGLTGALNALFAPARQGSIPELVRDGLLAKANGLMGLANVVPCALGFLLGYALAHWAQTQSGGPVTSQGLGLPMAVVLLIAVSGWLISLQITRVPAADPRRPIPWNPLRDTADSVRLLWNDTMLFRTALGIAFFWLLASLAQINIDTFGRYQLELQPWQIGVLGGILVIGVGIGSVLAGYWSGGHVELGIVPVGAVGIATCACLLFFAGVVDERFQWETTAFWWSIFGLFSLGICAGLFDVPLEAFLQHHSDGRQLGKVLAGTNCLVCVATLFSALLFYLLLGVAHLKPATVFLIAGLGTLPVAAYIVVLLPGATIRFLFWMVTRTWYRVRIHGLSNVPETGGALLVSNHVSWVDGILLMTCAPRPIRFIAYADYVNHPRLNWLAKIFEVIPIKANAGPKALLQSLKVARESVEQGHVVCIFAEGTLTRTGQLQPFQPGFLKIISGLSAPVIPVYLHGLWGSIFSFRGGKFFWKWPQDLRRDVSIQYGTAIQHPESVDQVRQAVQQLGVDAVERRKYETPLLPYLMIRQCHQTLFRPKVSDSTGVSLTGGKLLTAVLAFRKLLNRVLTADDQMLGLMLPTSAGAAIVNLATTFSRRVPINLNYTLGDPELRFCIRDAGIRTVITSRKLLEKRPFDFGDTKVLYTEDLKPQITTWDRLSSLVLAFMLPASLLLRWLGLNRLTPDDLLTVIYTSGSTGEPKGVMLTQHNVRANVESVDQLFHLTPDDCLLGVLPFFHSFGYTAGMWLPMTLPPRVTYHFNPLDARQVVKLCREHGVSIMFTTPTFLRSYLKRAEKADFHKLDLCVVGAEKLPQPLANEFHEKIGIWPIEGYGCTELSPIAAVNVPDHRCDLVEQRGTKLGSVGRPLPNVTTRVVDPETGEPRGVNQEGLVWIKGPNVMAGYLNQPEKTASVIRDGWYNTGDFGKVDEEGFLHITGRMSRFSKIGGEMVPHLKVEECLTGIIGRDPNAGEDTEETLRVAVTAVPDEQKGERLVVLHRPLNQPVSEIIKQLSQQGLPNLWIPSADSFVEVEQIPILGTGKLDLKQLKQVALEKFCTTAS